MHWNVALQRIEPPVLQRLLLSASWTTVMSLRSRWFLKYHNSKSAARIAWLLMWTGCGQRSLESTTECSRTNPRQPNYHILLSRQVFQPNGGQAFGELQKRLGPGDRRHWLSAKRIPCHGATWPRKTTSLTHWIGDGCSCQTCRKPFGSAWNS